MMGRQRLPGSGTAGRCHAGPVRPSVVGPVEENGGRCDRMFIFDKAGPHPTSWTGFVRRSADGGKTWSKAEMLPAGLLGPIKNKPVELKPGVILAGTSVESHRAWCSWVERSEDDGKTWRRF